MTRDEPQVESEDEETDDDDSDTDEDSDDEELGRVALGIIPDINVI